MVKCDECVSNDFGTVKKLVFSLLLASGLSGGLGGWAVYASSEKDSTQNSRLSAVEANQSNVKEQLDRQDVKLDKLIALSTQINLDVQTHIAGKRD